MGRSPVLALEMFAPDPTDTAAAIAPFVFRRQADTDPAFEHQVADLGRKWRRRRRRRALFGWLPSGAHLPRILRGRRTQDYVRDSYSETWSAQDWPDTAGAPARKALSLAAWRAEGLEVRRGGLARGHMPAIAAAFDRLKPVTVLEVGAGMGLNLFTLSARFPEIHWTGIELTEAGVARAKSVQREAALPSVIANYCPWPVADASAYRRIDFQQRDATRLPFDDDTFDLVFTRQALEQMEPVRDAALSEIARVAKTHVVMLEPFADFNVTSLNRDFVRAKDYFSLPVAGLARFGIEPRFTHNDFPQKLTLGQGLVVGEMGSDGGEKT